MKETSISFIKRECKPCLYIMDIYAVDSFMRESEKDDC